MWKKLRNSYIITPKFDIIFKLNSKGLEAQIFTILFKNLIICLYSLIKTNIRYSGDLSNY